MEFKNLGSYHENLLTLPASHKSRGLLFEWTYTTYCLIPQNLPFSLSRTPFEWIYVLQSYLILLHLLLSLLWFTTTPFIAVVFFLISESEITFNTYFSSSKHLDWMQLFFPLDKASIYVHNYVYKRISSSLSQAWSQAIRYGYIIGLFGLQLMWWRKKKAISVWLQTGLWSTHI